MFGSRIRLAKARSYEAIAPLVAQIQSQLGIPPGFWSDAFVQNFFIALIGCFSAAENGGLMREGGAVKVIPSVLSKLSHMDGQRIFVEGWEQIDSESGKNGGDLAILLFATMSGSEVKKKEHPYYIRACTYAEIGSNIFEGTRQEMLAAGLVLTVLFPEIKDRFSIA